MGLEFMTDDDLRKITEAAICLDEEGVEPTEEVIEAIADGDEDIPIIIRNFAEMRGPFWTSLESGIHFLTLERELDEERFEEAEAKHLAQYEGLDSPMGMRYLEGPDLPD